MTSVETATKEARALDVETDQALTKTGAPAVEDTGPVTVAHVVDSNHAYPGEVVTLYTCVGVREPISDLTLRIAVPTGLEPDDYRAPSGMRDPTPHIQVDTEAHFLVWSLPGEHLPGARYEYQAQARVAPVEWNTLLESQAVVTNGDHGFLAEESATVAVWARGRYLRFLPELYEQDELMGRLLMLFESFWAPIEMQIGATPYYLEPRMTPTRLLPWLAGWLGLDLDGRLPEDRQRELVRSAIWLYRRRGTKQALQRYLEIFTGGRVHIVEHRASDFRLGPEGRLGLGVALGRGNRPHTFTVRLHLPRDSASEPVSEDRRQEKRTRRMIEAIIEAEKPAHTDYTLIVKHEE
jgi:phage tail-like protein